MEVRAAGEQLLKHAQHALQMAALHHLIRRPRQVRLPMTRTVPSDFELTWECIDSLDDLLCEAD